MDIREVITKHSCKTELMMEAATKWCIANPGKKVLITRPLQSFLMSYNAKNKVMIYSPVKAPEPSTVAIDEFCHNWHKERWMNATTKSTEET